ncbi:MAG: hypothetical protein DBY09_06785 [Selenomonadales bacterium]|nr:MAG: hypothetical protein DBY09_06785 [Selenomonadales bacterium]
MPTRLPRKAGQTIMWPALPGRPPCGTAQIRRAAGLLSFPPPRGVLASLYLIRPDSPAVSPRLS